MKIQNITNSFSLSSSQEKIYISKDTFNKAKEIAKRGNIALIYSDKVLKISKDTLDDLISNFKGDIKTYDGIYIATNKAKEYMEKITDFVLNDLGVASADLNKDGVLTPQEKVNAKSMLYNNQIVKPKDVLSTSELLHYISQQKSETIDEIIDENIRFDKNKDGKVSALEVSKGLKVKENKSSGEDELTRLFKKMAEIKRKIDKLSKDKEKNKELINSLQTQLATIMARIAQLLKMMSG